MPETAREAVVAEAINKARYEWPASSIPYRTLAESSPSDWDYCRRLARAAIATITASASAPAGVADLTRLREEVQYWRDDLSARLWFLTAEYKAAVREKQWDRAAEISTRLNPALASYESAEAGEWHSRCEACGEFILPTEPYAGGEDVSGHARCLLDGGTDDVWPDKRAEDLAARYAEGRAALKEADAEYDTALLAAPPAPAPTSISEVEPFLKALFDGYKIIPGRQYVVVENPAYAPDNGENPYLVCPTHSALSAIALMLSGSSEPPLWAAPSAPAPLKDAEPSDDQVEAVMAQMRVQMGHSCPDETTARIYARQFARATLATPPRPAAADDLRGAAEDAAYAAAELTSKRHAEINARRDGNSHFRLSREYTALAIAQDALKAYNAALTGTVTPPDAAGERERERNRWIDWRGAVEGMDASLRTAAKAVDQVRDTSSECTSEKIAHNVCWMIGLDHLWRHVEALRTALAEKEAPNVAEALRQEADRLHAKADAILAVRHPPEQAGTADGLREALKQARTDLVTMNRSFVTRLSDLGYDEPNFAKINDILRDIDAALTATPETGGDR